MYVLTPPESSAVGEGSLKQQLWASKLPFARQWAAPRRVALCWGGFEWWGGPPACHGWQQALLVRLSPGKLASSSPRSEGSLRPQKPSAHWLNQEWESMKTMFRGHDSQRNIKAKYAMICFPLSLPKQSLSGRHPNSISTATSTSLQRPQASRTSNGHPTLPTQQLRVLSVPSQALGLLRLYPGTEPQDLAMVSLSNITISPHPSYSQFGDITAPSCKVPAYDLYTTGLRSRKWATQSDIAMLWAIAGLVVSFLDDTLCSPWRWRLRGKQLQGIS